jgi:NAD(P)-dependent dehydrogenase (short-subunit alcohol dehydrogenase family)
MVEQLLAAYGRWDTLVNNAAATITRPFPQITEAEFDMSFAANVKGVLHGLQLTWEPGRQRADHHHLQLDHRVHAARLRGLRLHQRRGRAIRAPKLWFRPAAAQAEASVNTWRGRDSRSS